MDIINLIKTKFWSRHFLWSNNAILIYLALAKLVIHLLTSTGYGYFMDELYWLAMTKHLDFGYVDVPPLVAYLGALSRSLIGASLFAIHLLPAIAGAVMVYFAGLIARELGGGRFAQWLTALMVITAPIWLALNSWFAYDPFDQLCTIIFFYLVVRIINRETPKRWLLLGIIAGLGVMTKLSLIFMGGALVVSLLLTSRRKSFLTVWPWLAALITALICTPYLGWQSIHGWPLLKYWRYYSFGRPHPGLLEFFGEQLMYLNPVTLPIWILGLYYLLFHGEGKKYRVLGLIYLILQLLFVGVMKLEPRMSVSAYFPLLAAGAVFAEKLIVSLTARRLGWNRFKPVFTGILLLSGLILAPLALPILPIPTLEKYGYVKRDSPLPVQFLFRFGWPEMVEKIAVVYNSLPEAERRKCVIYTSTYAEAGAIDLLGKTYDLPGAISNNLSYQIWGLGKYSGEVVIAFGFKFRRQTMPGDDYPPNILPSLFNEVTKTDFIIGNKYSIVFEQNLPVYICRKPKTSLKEAWKQLENYGW